MRESSKSQGPTLPDSRAIVSALPQSPSGVEVQKSEAAPQSDTQRAACASQDNNRTLCALAAALRWTAAARRLAVLTGERECG